MSCWFASKLLILHYTLPPAYQQTNLCHTPFLKLTDCPSTYCHTHSSRVHYHQLRREVYAQKTKLGFVFGTAQVGRSCPFLRVLDTILGKRCVSHLCASEGYLAR
ncbi:hypothetical protein HD806DRAFT_249407 [Xylariaceae sp. AK1471]|nr:hypothetical protein HD806DRAFT_249407 [Xylariaceae sp. AK1471]